ncbi:MAG: hypothetical protein L6R30_06880 [Thermoanaerobaculia bacterium]|nr:hypothetical protein [Thermoanaerobaculia bacterium]MCK6682130.1 hypothetical protein [Thermoanaerobaculia bacterium]
MNAASISVDSEVTELIARHFPGVTPRLGAVEDPEAAAHLTYVIVPVSVRGQESEARLEALRKELRVRGLSGITVELDYS